MKVKLHINNRKYLENETNYICVLVGMLRFKNEAECCKKNDNFDMEMKGGRLFGVGEKKKTYS
ncbi:hypothetical protein CN899_29080 [Bacillus thuringiensis]|uniref:Uncharacterized protein n=1 Tax=Bacillus thuringiensis TaxID=1428 RepID=A0A9X7GG87_BACTU|nr:hypothetical protein CN899_29080 [Bacillus thuringiensis]